MLLRSCVLADRCLGDDWDELERKAAKCEDISAVGFLTLTCFTADAKRVEGGRKAKDSDDSEDDKPKKKKPVVKANGKPKGKR